MLTLYHEALALRRQLPALGDGSLTWLDVGRGALAFHRDPGFVCVVNVADAPLTIRDELLRGGDVLLASGPLAADGGIPGATAVWLAVTGLDL